MKNKGLLTRPSIANFGSHKSEQPTDFPNRIEATTEGTVQPTQDVIPTNDTPPEKPADHSSTTHTDSLTVKEQKKPRSPRKGKSGEPRYSLNLQVEATSLQLLDQLLGGLPQADRVPAKRSFMRSFRKELFATRPAKSNFKPKDPAALRVDLRLPDDIRDAILKAEGALIFEETATVLARNISPRLDDYLRRALSSK